MGQLDLQDAYHCFFTVKGTGHPKFKSRNEAAIPVYDE